MARTQLANLSHIASFLVVTALTTSAASAALPPKNGGLPIYPGAMLPGHGDASKIPAAAWAKGFSTELVSKDSTATVDAWYRVHLRGYLHAAKSTGTAYQGPGGSLRVMDSVPAHAAQYGKTVIMMFPAS